VQGVIVRPLRATGLPRCIRISTGTTKDNERCVAAMQKAVRVANMALR
jgi:histidinol-phosphate/aromatic aminotransferase/cobyric acid decarboxylase-like protein